MTVRAASVTRIVSMRTASATAGAPVRGEVVASDRGPRPSRENEYISLAAPPDVANALPSELTMAPRLMRSLIPPPMYCRARSPSGADDSENVLARSEEHTSELQSH